MEIDAHANALRRKCTCIPRRYGKSGCQTGAKLVTVARHKLQLRILLIANLGFTDPSLPNRGSELIRTLQARVSRIILEIGTTSALNGEGVAFHAHGGRVVRRATNLTDAAQSAGPDLSATTNV
jgi:hypothetical protein